MEDHEAAQFYWSVESSACPHGPEPEPDTDAWHDWWDRHQTSDDGPICLDAPAGTGCSACSAEQGDMVPWSRCEGREHVRPKRGITPTPEPEHQPVPVWVGRLECLERECEEYFTDDGDEITGREVCSHIREETSCSCLRLPDGGYSMETCPALTNA